MTTDKNIKINYAYNGIIYSPLFLADKLKLFPGNIKLEYRYSDEGAIEALAPDSEDIPGEENWFAICDPFSGVMERYIKGYIGKDDKFVIIGTLVNKLPVWAYTYHRKEERVPLPYEKEDELVESINKSKLVEIKCYKCGNTGYLIGKRIQKRLNLPDSIIKEYEFGKEFEDNLQDNCLILTSDILKMLDTEVTNDIGFIRKKRFSYAREKWAADFDIDKIASSNPYLFTAIITRQKIIDEHLDTVCAVLGALQASINILKSQDIDKYIECIQDYVNENHNDDENSNSTHLKNMLSAEAQEDLIRRAIKEISSSNLYPDCSKFSFQDNKIAYKNAKYLWDSDKPELINDEDLLIEMKLHCNLLPFLVTKASIGSNRNDEINNQLIKILRPDELKD